MRNRAAHRQGLGVLAATASLALALITHQAAEVRRVQGLPEP